MDLTNAETFPAEGILEIASKNNYARLMTIKNGGRPSGRDVYVPVSFAQKLRLKTGNYLEGTAVRDSDNHSGRLIRVDRIDGLPLSERRTCMPFLSATSTSPRQKIHLERNEMTTRVLDLFVPLGRGQRSLVVAPPKTGKTRLLQQIALSIGENEPDCHLMIVLIDERPEEVTEFRRLLPQVEIYASSNDEPLQRHIQVAQLAFLRAQNLAETGRHVVLLLDSLTRLARAFNNAHGRSGRTLSGGLDSQALERPRQLFSLARNTEEIGSLTVIATALVETGSRMDDLIFQEFKGTGNSEIVLDRRLAERRIFPAINLAASGTRREELLIPASQLEQIQFLRRACLGSRAEDAAETLMARLSKTRNNAEFLSLLARR